ncbi:MAG: alpha/beta hydrolase, partial [Xenococcaceae cyanobacterium MO_234.B1]|nr:alpha/beta hydrolase [Xenococcaceae cyanobacterium MO_234.B1]
MRLEAAHFLFSLILGTLTAVGTLLPAQGAERINFIITGSPLKFSLRISSLEAFAADGTVDRGLADYMRITGASE